MEIGSLDQLGKSLHPLQDTFAHTKKYVQEKNGIYYHADPKNPLDRGQNLADDATLGDGRADKTEKATSDIMKMYKERNFDKDHSVWNSYDPPMD